MLDDLKVGGNNEILEISTRTWIPTTKKSSPLHSTQEIIEPIVYTIIWRSSKYKVSHMDKDKLARRRMAP